MKIFDKVKLLKSVYQGDKLAPGKTGVIVDIVDGSLFQVALDSGYTGVAGESETWAFFEHELEVIK